jgi:hydrophobic/amphiphilic exporter-1 (mainly G- bacteria), HAE1 family
MQWLAALCVRRPVFATVLILMLTVVGAFSFTQLGVDRYPKVDFPTIVVTTRNPGAAPEEIESEVTDKVEEAVNTVSGIDELRSTSAEGVSIVAVTFLLEKDVEVAAQEVRDRVNRVLPQLPRTVRQPTVEKMDPDASPIVTLVLSAPRPIRDITEYADKVLRRQLESVDGVGQVMIVGGRARQVNVNVDAGRLRAYNLTVTDVSRALQSQNLDVPGGRVELGPQTLTLRTQGRVHTVEQFGQVVVRQRESHPVTIGDVADVEDGMADAVSLANVNGKPAVVMPIRRQSGTNAVEVVDTIKARLDELAPTIPPGYQVRIVRDQSEFIKASIRNVEEHLVLGSILAALVVLVFLGNLRTTIIAAIAIPTSIISSFGLIWYEGFTLNMMTMLALTLSVGIVIDDAIVVLENIYRFVEEKKMPPMRAAVEATREIGLAVLATTMSLVAIFLPLGFMGGIVGKFMKSFGLTMAFAVLVSLLVSFTLTPMLASRWLKGKGNGNGDRNGKTGAAGEEDEAGAGGSHGAPPHTSRDSRFFHPIDRGYTWLLEWALHHRGVVAAAAFLVLSSSVPLAIVAPKNFMPIDDQSEFEVGIRAPEGTSLESTELVANRVASQIRARISEAQYTLVTVADDSAGTRNVATVYTHLTPIEERSRDQFAVMAEVRDRLLPQFAAERLRTGVRQSGGMGGGGAASAEIQFVINGPDLRALQQAANAVAAEARKMNGVVDVDTSLNVGKPELAVRLDRAKAADLGVQISDAADALRLLVGGDQITTYNEGGEQYDVFLRARPTDRTAEAALAALTVPSSRLGSVSLDNLATFGRSEAPSEIMRLQRQRQVTIYASLLPGFSQTPVMAAMQQRADGLNLGATYRSRFAGRSRELGRAATNFGLAFLLSLVFMYLILAAQFESWLHPVTILLSLPLTLPFALVSVLITGQSLNVMSALGLLVLFGVVKKNSILQIDHANQLHASGMERHAAVVQSSRDRLRPILMTTLAFVAGMIPLVLSGGVGAGTNRAIGFIIIGGQTLVLMLTLVVTPVAYSLFDDVKSFRFGRRKTVPSEAATGAGIAAIVVAIGVGLWPGRAYAQGTPGTAQPPAPSTVTGPSLSLSLDDAVRMGLANNLDIVVERLEPQVSLARVWQAGSAFVPSLVGALSRNSQGQPPTSPLLGTSGVNNELFSSNVGVAQRLPWFGTSYAVGVDGSKTTTTSTFTNYNPTLTARFQATISQPLLRDFSIDNPRQQLILSKRNRDISDARFRETVVRTLDTVKRGYWDLVAANALADVQRQSLELSEELVRQDQARVTVGQMPELDLLAAQAEAAQRQENLTIALVAVRQAEDRLRTLILDVADAAFWTTRLVPSDRPPVGAPLPGIDNAVTAALSGRQDLVRARKELENAQTVVKYYSNQRLPDVRLSANAQGNGLAGTQLIRSGGFLGPVTGQQEIAYSEAWRQVFNRDYPTWTVGVTVSYPLGRSYDDASLAGARLQEAQARARLQSLEMRVVRQIRQAGWLLEMNASRIDTSRAARSLAERRADSEQKRFEVGMSTSFLVIQAQRDLAQARNNELSAILDYARSLTDFEALQEAPLDTSGSVTVTGGSVTAPGAIPAAAGQVLSNSSATRIGGQ